MRPRAPAERGRRRRRDILCEGRGGEGRRCLWWWEEDGMGGNLEVGVGVGKGGRGCLMAGSLFCCLFVGMDGEVQLDSMWNQ